MTASSIFAYLCVLFFLESRPLSVPVKAMPDTTAEEAWMTSEERMKALIANAWDAVKRLTVQVPASFLCPEPSQQSFSGKSYPFTPVTFSRNGFDLWSRNVFCRFVAV